MGRIARIAAKVALALAAFVVVASLVGVAFLRTERGHEVLRRLVVAQARKTVPGLSLGALGGGLLRDLSLRDVEIRDAQGRTAVHVDALTVRYRLRRLLRREIAIDDLQVHGLAVLGVPDPAGGLNLAHLTTPSPEEREPRAAAQEGPSRWTIDVARALVDGASAQLEAADGATRTLTSLTAEASVHLDAHAVDVRLGSLTAHGLLPEGGVVSASGRASGPRDRIATHGEVETSAAGRVTIDGTVGLRAARDGTTTLGAYALTLDVVDLDPSGLRAGAPSGSVSLTLRASGEGLPPSADARARLELAVARSELAGVPVLGGRARANVDGDVWELGPSELRAEGASLTLSGRGRGGRLSADVGLALSGAAVRGRAKRAVHGHGSLTLHAEGTLGQTLALRGRASAQDLRVQFPRRRALRLRALALELKGRVTLPASSSKATSPRVSGRIEGHLADLAAGDARVGDATLSVDVDGTAAAPNGAVSLVANHVVAARGAPAIDRANVALSAERGQLRVQASARGPRLRAAVGAHGTASAAAGDVTVDQLALDVTTPAYRQQLTLTEPARVRYRAGEEVTLARTVIKGAGARFTGQATLEGEYRPRASGRTPLGRVVLRLANASTGGLTPLNASLDATVTRTRGTVHLEAAMPGAAAQLKLDADVPLDLPRRGRPRLASRGHAEVHLTTNRIRLQAVPGARQILGRVGVTGGTVALDLHASGDIAHPDAQCAFDLRDVTYRNLAGLGRDSRLKTVPGLGGSLKVDAKAGSVSADAQLLIRGAGVIDAHAALPIDLGRLLAGARPAQIPVHATVKIPKLRLSSLADFTDVLKGVDGQLRGTVEVSGTLDRPIGQADLAVDDAQVDKLRFKEVQLHAEARQGAVHGRLGVEEGSGGRLDGSMKVELRDDRFEAYLTGKDLDVSFLRLFLPNVREIAGVAQLSASAKGTLGAPQVWATLSLEKGRVGVTGQPTFKDVRVALALAPGRLDLHELEMSSGDGHLKGSGWVTLGGPHGMTPKEAVLKAHAHRFLVAVAGAGGARVDGDLAFDAALKADVLTGKVDVPNASIWLPKTPSGGGGNLQKVGQRGDVHFVDATAQAAAERDLERQRQAANGALRVALKATASPVYVRGRDLDLEVHTDVQIGTVPSGPHRGAVTLDGAIHIPRGRLNIQGQRFDIDHGDLTFDGSWDVNPALDIRLTRQFPDALVVIELRGTPKKPELRLTSDPAIYDQAQIVSFILTGQPGGTPSSGNSFDPTAAVTTAVLSRLADQVAPELGLDVMRVGNQAVTNAEGVATGETDTRVEVGKYVTERIYLSYAHIFGAPENANQNEAHVEYRLTRRWMLQTIFGDAGQGSVDALWTYRF